jgi:hypothetical protein
MILKIGDKLDPEALRRETRVFNLDTRLTRWHGITFGGQEFRAEIKGNVAEVYELKAEEKPKERKVKKEPSGKKLITKEKQ